MLLPLLLLQERLPLQQQQQQQRLLARGLPRGLLLGLLLLLLLLLLDLLLGLLLGLLLLLLLLLRRRAAPEDPEPGPRLRRGQQRAHWQRQCLRARR